MTGGYEIALRARIEALGPWFHNLDLNGVATAPEHCSSSEKLAESPLFSNPFVCLIRYGIMDVLVARQAIFDCQRKLYGYELLFRSDAVTNAFDGTEDAAATNTIPVTANTSAVNTTPISRTRFSAKGTTPRPSISPA